MLACSVSATAAPYDDFDDRNFLSADSWRFSKNFSNVLENGKLRVQQRRGDENRSNNIRFPDPASINAIQATVNLQQDTISDANSRARIAGYFCDTDNTANGAIGEVFANIGIGSFPDTTAVNFFLFRCDNSDCNTGTTLLEDSTTLGPPTLNTDHVLSLAFDQTSQTFTFGFDGNTVEVGSAQVAELANCGATNSSFKAISSVISHQISNTHSPAGDIVALFDDIQVNGAPYDDFSGDFMDATKWNERDLERTILVEEDTPGNNVVRLAQRRSEIRNRSNNLQFADPDNIDFIKTTVRVDRAEVENPNGDIFVRARINGNFYNDGSSTDSDDRTGDVFFQLRLQRRLNGTPQNTVDCSGFRCDDAQCDNGTDVFFHRFGTWQQGETYTLELGLDKANNAIVCRFEDQEFIQQLQATDPQPVASAVDNFKALGTRIDDGLESGAFGEVSAVFDNVEINSHIVVATPASLTLSPDSERNTVNSTHTVTATVQDDAQAPTADVAVGFEITAGPNQGETGQATTDVNGQASFNYVGDGGTGVDLIQASVTTDSDLLQSNTVRKIWFILATDLEPDADAPEEFNLGFGMVNATGERTITVTNPGSAAVRINAINITGTGFSISSETCSNATLQANSANSCQIVVEFNPVQLAVGEYSGQVIIDTELGNQVINLSATVETFVPIPTLSQWAMLIVASLLILSAAWARRWRV